MAKTLDIDELMNGISGAAAEQILRDYIAPVMWDILQKHISTDIYGAYTPKQDAWIGGRTYNRRYSLIGDGGMVTSMLAPDEIMVTSNAAPDGPLAGSWSDFAQGGGFLAMLENGYMGFWTKTTGRTLPRPAISNAQKEIDDSPEIRAALKRGLQGVLGLG